MIAIGHVVSVRHERIEVSMPALPIGADVCVEIEPCRKVYASVVACEPGRTFVLPNGPVDGVLPGMRVTERCDAGVRFGCAALGYAIDAGASRRLQTSVPRPAERGSVVRPLWTGIRAIDALTTIGRGARVGIFGGPGLGKSVLVEWIVGGAHADAVVVALVGERGREARAWLDLLGPKTTIVTATSDRCARERVRAAEAAFAQARALAARGLNVLLVLDSLARYATALRELALASGEPVGRGGFPASVFSGMATLVEGAGAFECGSITLIATVLDDGDQRDPVSEAARSLLDGHLQLSPRLAHEGRFPALDIGSSVSRTMPLVATTGHRRNAALARAAIAELDRSADARAMGIEGATPAIRAALAAESSLERLLRQHDQAVCPTVTLAMLQQTADILEEAYEHCL